jgi:hypothetical protein
MSDDYSSSDCGSSYSHSDHSSCSTDTSSHSHCSNSDYSANAAANDLLMYGMAVHMMTACDEPGKVKRERIPPEDFVIMRRGRMYDTPPGEPTEVAEERDRQERLAAMRYEEKLEAIDEVGDSRVFAWFARGFVTGAAAVAFLWIIWSVI